MTKPLSACLPLWLQGDGFSSAAVCSRPDECSNVQRSKVREEKPLLSLVCKSLEVKPSSCYYSMTLGMLEWVDGAKVTE